MINKISPITRQWDHELQVLIYREGDRIISVPKTHNFIPNIGKHQTNPSWSYSKNNWSVFLLNVRIIKDKEKLNTFYDLKEVKEESYWNVMWDPWLDPGTEK